MLAEMARTPKKGLQLIWISPIRALTKEIQQSTERALFGLGYPFEVAIRTGDMNLETKPPKTERCRTS